MLLIVPTTIPRLFRRSEDSLEHASPAPASRRGPDVRTLSRALDRTRASVRSSDRTRDVAAPARALL